MKKCTLAKSGLFTGNTIEKGINTAPGSIMGRIRKFTKVILWLAVIILGIVLILLLDTDYDTLISRIANFTGSQRHITKIKSVIKPDSINLLTGFILFNFILCAWMIARFNTLIIYLFPVYRKTGFSIKTRIKHDYNAPFLLLLIIPILSTILFAFIMPVGNDEAYTYVNYTSRSIFACAFYYPDPNNHILHSILTNIFSILPLPALAVLRIPVILISILNLFVFFSLVKEYFNKNIALSALAIYSVFTMTLYYSYMSRGYALQAFTFLIVTYSLFKIIKNPANKLYWLYYMLGAVAGFYTLPSFLYPFLMISLFLLIRLRKITREFFISNLLIVIFVIYLYVPVFIFTGLDSVISNKFVVPIDRSEVIARLPGFLLNTIYELTGLNSFIVLAVAIVSSVLLVYRFRKPYNYFFIWIVALGPIILLLHSVIPFARTFNYWGFSFALFMAVAIVFCIERSRLKVPLILILMILQSILAINFSFKVKDREKISLAAHQEIEKVKDGKNFYVCSSLFDKYLVFDLKTRNKSDYHIKYYKGKPINLDTVPQKEGYDFLIVDTPMDLTKDLSLVSKNKFYSIYKGHSDLP